MIKQIFRMKAHQFLSFDTLSSKISPTVNQSKIEDLVSDIRKRLLSEYTTENEVCKSEILLLKEQLIRCLTDSINTFRNPCVSNEHPKLDSVVDFVAAPIDYEEIGENLNQSIENVSYDVFLGFVEKMSGGKQSTRHRYRHYLINVKSDSGWLRTAAALTSLVCVTPVYTSEIPVSNHYSIFGNVFASLMAVSLILKIMMRLKFTARFFLLDQADRSPIIHSMLNDSLMLFSQVSACMFMLGGKSNLFPDMNGIPVMMVIAIGLIPLLQIFFNVSSRCTLISCYIISIISTNFYLSRSEAPYSPYLFVNTLYLILLCASYEIERSSIAEFIRFVEVSNLSRLNASLQLEVIHERCAHSKEAQDSKRTSDSKSRIVKQVGHEVRTPLNIMFVGVEMLSCELLKFANLLPSVIFDTIGSLKEASTAALDGINELMLFEKLTSGMNCIEPTPVKLVNFLKECMSFHNISVRAKNLKFELIFRIEDSEIFVRVDPMKLKTVFRNLLSNAIKFTPIFGEVVLKVTIQPESESSGREFVVISVKDSGAGLSTDNLANMFQEGVQFNANSLQDGGGSGLGLFITKELVAQHKDCSIWVESHGEGCGCTFFVKIPLMNSEEVLDYENSVVKNTKFDNKKSSDVFHGTSNAPPALSPLMMVDASISLNVLLVDDSAANRKIMSRLLTSLGHSSFHACDGVQAVDMVSNSLRVKQLMEVGDAISVEAVDASSHVDYDVVLMDSLMPNMNGLEAAAAMRQLGYKGPIIGVTGLEDSSDFVAAGADQVLLKPVSSAILQQAIDDAMRHRMSLRRRPSSDYYSSEISKKTEPRQGHCLLKTYSEPVDEFQIDLTRFSNHPSCDSYLSESFLETSLKSSLASSISLHSTNTSQ